MRSVIRPTISALPAVSAMPMNSVIQGDMPVLSVSQAVV